MARGDDDEYVMEWLSDLLDAYVESGHQVDINDLMGFAWDWNYEFSKKKPLKRRG